MTGAVDAHSVLKVTILLLLVLPIVQATVGLNETCSTDDNAPEEKCDEAQFLQCNSDNVCVCQESYTPSYTHVNVSCLAPVGYPCSPTHLDSCNNSLSKCMNAPGAPNTCRCLTGYLEMGFKCLAPLSKPCLLHDGCLDEHAICVAQVTPTPSSTTVADELSRAPLGFNGHEDVVAQDPLAHDWSVRYRIWSSRNSSENMICVCDDGFEIDEDGERCILSGSFRLTASLLVAYLLALMTRSVT